MSEIITKRVTTPNGRIVELTSDPAEQGVWWTTTPKGRKVKVIERPPSKESVTFASQRVAICQGCEHYEASAKCAVWPGCMRDRWADPTGECPAGKWPENKRV